ncbi:MAG: LapA family protein [Chitinophagales bacterium]|nr:LapA family protein [Bacteroidota bacterium]MCB9257441.1 LapA family protein [Chitinophagales bacterium]
MTKVVNTIRAIILFILLFFILIFCFQNRQEVSIQFLKMKIESMPLFIALFATLSTGLLIGFLGGMITGSKAKRAALRKEETRALREEKNDI